MTETTNETCIQVEDPLATPKNGEGGCKNEKESKKMITSSETAAQLGYETTDELLSMLRQRQLVDMTAEDMDPFEYGFRRAVPIPAHYYWDICRNEEDLVLVPNSIKLWHNSIAGMTYAYHWTERRVGWPLARMLGLTKPRFHDVTMFMTEDDWKESERILAERREQREMSGQDAIAEVATDIETSR